MNRVEWFPTVCDGFGYGERWEIKGGYPFRVFMVDHDLWEGATSEGYARFRTIKEAASFVESHYRTSRGI